MMVCIDKEGTGFAIIFDQPGAAQSVLRNHKNAAEIGKPMLFIPARCNYDGDYNT